MVWIQRKHSGDGVDPIMWWCDHNSVNIEVMMWILSQQSFDGMILTV